MGQPGRAADRVRHVSVAGDDPGRPRGCVRAAIGTVAAGLHRRGTPNERLAGEGVGAVHDDERLPAGGRLYLTATPRVWEPPGNSTYGEGTGEGEAERPSVLAGDAAWEDPGAAGPAGGIEEPTDGGDGQGDEDEGDARPPRVRGGRPVHSSLPPHAVASMEDERIFGPTVHRLELAAGVRLGLLARPRIVVVDVAYPTVQGLATAGGVDLNRGPGRRGLEEVEEYRAARLAALQAAVLRVAANQGLTGDGTRRGRGASSGPRQTSAFGWSWRADAASHRSEFRPDWIQARPPGPGPRNREPPAATHHPRHRSPASRPRERTREAPVDHRVNARSPEARTSTTERIRPWRLRSQHAENVHFRPQGGAPQGGLRRRAVKRAGRRRIPRPLPKGRRRSPGVGTSRGRTSAPGCGPVRRRRGRPAASTAPSPSRGRVRP